MFQRARQPNCCAPTERQTSSPAQGINISPRWGAIRPRCTSNLKPRNLIACFFLPETTGPRNHTKLSNTFVCFRGDDFVWQKRTRNKIKTLQISGGNLQRAASRSRGNRFTLFDAGCCPRLLRHQRLHRFINLQVNLGFARNQSLP